MSGGHGHEVHGGHDDHGHAPKASSGGGGSSSLIGSIAAQFNSLSEIPIHGIFK